MSDTVKLYVGNLPERCEERALQDLFSPYGKIGEPKIIKNYAFIDFESEADAKKAVEDLHKTKLLGKELTVEISTSRQSRSSRRGNDRRPVERRSRNTGLSTFPGVPAPGGGGGILGMGPNGPLPALGLLSAMKNAVAAAAVASQNPVDQMSSFGNAYDGQQGGTSVGSRDMHQSASQDRKTTSDGYVIYERFYVDPSHPLLKGLPVPELPRVEDLPAFQDYRKKDTYVTDTSLRDDPYIRSSRDDSYSSARRDDPYASLDDPYAPRRDDTYSTRRDDYDNYRDRSPIQSRRDFDMHDSRSRAYGEFPTRR